MKKILGLIILLPIFMSNACSEDVVYEDAYGHAPKENKEAVINVVEDLHTKTELEKTVRQKELVKEMVSKTSPDGLVTGMQWKQAGKYAASFFGQWLDSWRSMNVEYYLSHYSKGFDNGEKDYAAWTKRKRELAKTKEYIKIKVSRVTLLQHPHKDIMAVTFLQDYRSNNYSDESWKRQFWQAETDGRWRIIYEKTIENPNEPFDERFID